MRKLTALLLCLALAVSGCSAPVTLETSLEPTALSSSDEAAENTAETTGDTAETTSKTEEAVQSDPADAIRDAKLVTGKVTGLSTGSITLMLGVKSEKEAQECAFDAEIDSRPEAKSESRHGRRGEFVSDEGIPDKTAEIGQADDSDALETPSAKAEQDEAADEEAEKPERRANRREAKFDSRRGRRGEFVSDKGIPDETAEIGKTDGVQALEVPSANAEQNKMPYEEAGKPDRRENRREVKFDGRPDDKLVGRRGDKSEKNTSVLTLTQIEQTFALDKNDEKTQRLLEQLRLGDELEITLISGEGAFTLDEVKKLDAGRNKAPRGNDKMQSFGAGKSGGRNK